MTTITINKVPDKLSFNWNVVDFDLFLERFIEYMQNLEDVENVKSEIRKDWESFDYNYIRGNYL